MKYKIGDKVRIKSLEDIKATLSRHGDCKRSGTYWNTSEMTAFCGRVATVIGFDDRGRQERVVLDIDPGFEWVWSQEWVEPAITKIKINLDESLFEL